jgi:hypothetical protein
MRFRWRARHAWNFTAFASLAVPGCLSSSTGHLRTRLSRLQSQRWPSALGRNCANNTPRRQGFPEGDGAGRRSGAGAAGTSLRVNRVGFRKSLTRPQDRRHAAAARAASGAS